MTLATYLSEVELFEYTQENFEMEKLLAEATLIELYLGAQSYSESVELLNESATSDEDKITLVTEAKGKATAEELQDSLSNKRGEFKARLDVLYDKSIGAIIRAVKHMVKWLSDKFAPNSKKVVEHLKKFDDINKVSGDSIAKLHALNPATSKIFESVEEDDYLAEAAEDAAGVASLLDEIFKKSKWAPKHRTEYRNAIMASSIDKDSFPVVLNLKTAINPGSTSTFSGKEKRIRTNEEMKEYLKVLEETRAQFGVVRQNRNKKAEDADAITTGKVIPRKKSVVNKDRRSYEHQIQFQKDVAEDIKLINSKIKFMSDLCGTLLTFKPVKS